MSPTLIPPGVCGRVRGSISIAVDEVFWCGSPKGDVYVKFSWWGSDEHYEFFPSDLTRVSGSARAGPTSHTFPVGTSMKFLEDYFRKWGSICFSVYRVSDKRLLGTARVDNWECILSDSRYGSYFAILDKKESRIGDLHIVFTLKMKKKRYKLKSDFPIVRDAPTTDWDKEKSGELLTDLLSKGQQLRKAMVKSVLSSCETKDLDEVVSSELAPMSPVADAQSEAKLVDYLMANKSRCVTYQGWSCSFNYDNLVSGSLSADPSSMALFLLGKDLSEPDKEIAINTLRCSSPSESVLEVAANFTDSAHSRETNYKGFDGSHPKRFCAVGEDKASADTRSVEKPVSPRGLASRIGARDPDEAHSVAPVHDEPFGNSYPRYENDKKLNDCSVNSFRVSFSVLTLTAVGLKKVSTSPTIKPLLNKIRTANPPGIVFSIETMMPIISKSKTTFLKPVTISSKAFGGNDATFSDSVLRKLRRSNEPAWTRVGQSIAGLPIKIYWRCLNQRLPSLLGQCMLPDEFESEDFEAHYHLDVYMANRQVAGVLSCKIELGASGVYGNDLLGRAKNKRKSRVESIIPQVSEVPPSRTSIGSPKSYSQNSKDSCFTQIPVPPSTARCRTASSATSNTREPVESDQQLLDAISCLNEKLTKKVVLPEMDHISEATTDQLHPTPAGPTETLQHPTSIPAEGSEVRPAPAEEKNCRHKSPRGCCCCCRGCPGDSKRKKSLRRKQVRDRAQPSRGSEAKQDDSSALSNTDGGDMSSERRIDANGLLRERRFHSPPTRLNRRPKEQLSKFPETHLRDGGLDSLYGDSPHRTDDFLRSQPKIPSDLYKTNLEKVLNRSDSDLSSVHRFVINPYSTDAHIFYREGELELYMVYRFPQVDPVSGKLFCPAEISTIELSGEGSPVTHYLPLRTRLSDALLSYPKHNITFHIWARSYLYEKRDFLIGQAKLPLEKLVEWEAAHSYCQKRRVDHPLLPPDKHLITLKIHPAKGEFPQHLEPGRIVQLGLEIEYEKFPDATNSFDAWPMNSTDSPSRPYYPTSHIARDEVTDSSDPYSNFRQNLSRDCNEWNRENRPLGGFSEKSGKWGVRLVDGLSDPAMPPAPRGCGKAGFSEASKGQRFCSANGVRSVQDDEEFMLILDGRCEPNRSAFVKNDDRGVNLPDHRVPDGDRSNGVWGDEKLQFHSMSRIDPAHTSEFIPDEELRAQLLSPRVDRDFPAGVRTADFSSDQSGGRNNPFDAPVTVHPQPGARQPEARIRVADQSSPLPSLAKVIDPNYRPRDSSPVPVLDSSYELGSDSKATQTTVNEQQPSLFSARVEVESAINLPLSKKQGVLTKPSSRIEFDAWNKGKEVMVQSSVVNEDSNPKYDSAWNVELPTHLLYKSDAEFELRVINVDDGSVSSAFIDLTTLSAGLPSIDGWYCLTSHGHKSAGQVKVTITPTESIRKYRDVWIEEYRKTKGEPQSCRRDDRLSCESAQKMMLNDSSSTKFKEKMKELEQLTKRMKKKLLDVDQWDSSPPCTLMRDVDNFAKQLLQEVNEPPQTKRASNHHVQSRGLPELDLSTVQQFCPVENDAESPDGDSIITIEDSPPPRDYTAPLHGPFEIAGSHSASRVPRPRRGPLSVASRQWESCRVNFPNQVQGEDSPDLTTPAFGSKSPVNLISFDDSPDERPHTYSLPSNSNDTSPTSPVNVFIREENDKYDDSDNSEAVMRNKLSLDKCHEELERLPRDSLDAASLAIEKMIADLRNQNADDPKS